VRRTDIFSLINHKAALGLRHTMPGFDKQYPPTCIDPRKTLHRDYQTEF